MSVYHLEPTLNFTHVLKAYTNLDTYVEVRLFENNKPMDCSECTGIAAVADKYQLDSSAFDTSGLAEGFLRFKLTGLPAGGYRIPIVLTFEDGPIVFGRVTVFVDDTTRSDDIAVFHQYPDTEDELEEFNGADDADDDDGDDSSQDSDSETDETDDTEDGGESEEGIGEDDNDGGSENAEEPEEEGAGTEGDSDEEGGSKVGNESDTEEGDSEAGDDGNEAVDEELDGEVSNP